MQDRSNLDWKRILDRLGVAASSDEGEADPLVRLGLPPVENPPLERRYANDEQWDWWKSKGE